MGNLLYTIVVFIIVLSVLVFVHELGHYMAAKAFGVWVHRFSIGMGKPIKALSMQHGETEWAVSWLPLGGYVKMASRDVDPASTVLEGGTAEGVPPDRVFEAKPVWQRMIIILAGVTLNVIFAWLIFTGLFWKYGKNFDPTTTIGLVDDASLPVEGAPLKGIVSRRIISIDGRPVSTWDDITSFITTGPDNQIVFAFSEGENVVVPIHRDALVERSRIASALLPRHPAVIIGVIPNTPAAKAGLQAGDSIVALNGVPVDQWAPVLREIKSSIDKPLALGLIRSGAPQTVTVIPRAEHEDPKDSTSRIIGRIGADRKVPFISLPLNLLGAIREGNKSSIEAATSIYRTFRGLSNGNVSRKEVGGPILIAQMASQQARQGLKYLLSFMAVISMNLAVVNLLPIPVLDGGAFVLLAVEGVVRRPLPVKLREVISMVGLALIALLMVTAFWNDIGRLLGR